MGVDVVLGVVVDLDVVLVFDGDGDANVGRDLPWVEDGSFGRPTIIVAVAVKVQDHVKVNDHDQDHADDQVALGPSLSYALND